jgi:hypothetical protein
LLIALGFALLVACSNGAGSQTAIARAHRTTTTALPVVATPTTIGAVNGEPAVSPDPQRR